MNDLVLQEAAKLYGQDSTFNTVQQYLRNVGVELTPELKQAITNKYFTRVDSDATTTPSTETTAVTPTVTAPGVVNTVDAAKMENFNSLNGGNDWMSLKGAFGGVQNGNKYSGWAMPAVNLGMAGLNAYVGYQGLQETKKMNKFNIEAKEEAMARQRVDQLNKLARARINQRIGMGNANSMAGTVATVAANPYTEYSRF